MASSEFLYPWFTAPIVLFVRHVLAGKHERVWRAVNETEGVNIRGAFCFQRKLAVDKQCILRSIMEKRIGAAGPPDMNLKVPRHHHVQHVKELNKVGFPRTVGSDQDVHIIEV